MATAVRRWDPFRDLMSIQSEMNRLFGRTYGNEVAEGDQFQGSWSPAVDIFQSEDGTFSVVCELPGLRAEEVEITVEDNLLTLRGERQFYNEVKEESLHRVERRFGAFMRRVALPQHADVSKIQASMNDGVLRIDVPKSEQAKPKKIEVRATTSADGNVQPQVVGAGANGQQG